MPNSHDRLKLTRPGLSRFVRRPGMVTNADKQCKRNWSAARNPHTSKKRLCVPPAYLRCKNGGLICRHIKDSGYAFLQSRFTSTHWLRSLKLAREVPWTVLFCLALTQNTSPMACLIPQIDPGAISSPQD